jgi:transglutaminase-like putative cysteine protease
MPIADQNRPQIDPAVVDDTISLPLYAGGLVVTLSGVMAVATANAVSGSSAVESVAVLLTLLGYAFSLACRHLRVQSRLLWTGFFFFLLYIGVRLLMHDASLQWFITGADRPETRLAAALMWLTVLWSWILYADDLVMASCVLSAAMIGLIGTQDVNAITVIYFSLFILGMTFLLIHQNYLQQRRLVTSREPVRPSGALIPIQLGLSVFCAIAVLGLGGILIAPAQALFANVSLARAIRGLVGSDHVSDLAVASSTPRFSDEDSLEIGKGYVWPTTSDVLLHVTPSDNAPHYWRGRTYDEYTGAGWKSTQGVSIQPRQSGQTTDGTLYTLPTSGMLGEGKATSESFPRQPMIASFDVRGDTEEFYYADEPHTLLLGNDVGFGPNPYADGRIDLGTHPVRSVYTVTSLPPPDLSRPDVQEHLRRDGTDYPHDVRDFYLQTRDDNNMVTSNADLRAYQRILNEALAGLPPDRHTPFDKALAIQAWISHSCTYSLDVDAIPDDVDHVRYFLTVSRRGYCDLFASSMVVLCRMAGIPARVATGFAPGDRDDTGFNVRAMDKHAWAEVYFPHDRWQIFDATVGTQADGSVPTVHSASSSFWSRAWTALTTGGPVTTGLSIAVLISLLYLGKTELYDRRVVRSRSKTTPTIRIEQGYGLLTRSLARLGLPRHSWETPSEYAHRAVPFLAIQESAFGVPLPASVVQSVTERFTAARYGAEESDAGVVLDSDLRAFASAAARARRIRAWRRFWHLKTPS